ncbi:hypothetical protein NM449_17715 (plasmid) [Vibrio metschnikovii]|uniref:hypothetical protein n=1 Tax=Vibrio metschnikovii TaxID=28172 RepID=UPI00315C8683
MSEFDYKQISSATLQDIPHLPAELVIAWLANQRDYMGEAVAKQCYQLISRSYSTHH